MGELSLDLVALVGLPVSVETARAVFLGPQPWRGEFAHLHTVFKGASKSEIERVRGRVPEGFLDFLALHNGADLFRTGYLPLLFVFGSPTPGPIDRLGGFESERPWDVMDRGGRSAIRGHVVVGGYGADESYVEMLPDGTIVRINESGRRLLGEWPSIGDWLETEIARLSKLVTRDGRFKGKVESESLP